MTRANPRLIGSFILGGVALLLLGVSWLASGRIFEKRFTFVVFFSEPVRGLEVGSPVTFSGVPAGQVRAIQAYITGNAGGPAAAARSSEIEVTIRVSRGFIRVPPGSRSDVEDLDDWEIAEFLAKNGLRAQLMTGSLVTGQLYIDLDFHPDLPARLSTIPSRYPQLPSAPNDLALLRSRIERILDRLASLPLDRIAGDLAEALEAIRDLARGPEIRAALVAASGAGQEMKAAFSDLDRLAVDLRAKVKDVEPGALAKDLSSALAAAQQSLKTVEAAAAGASTVEAQLNQTLHEIGRAAVAVRVLVEFLDKHPEALVQGKTAPSKKEK